MLSAHSSQDACPPPDRFALAFEAKQEDHCETDVSAYKHLVPFLLQLARSLHGRATSKHPGQHLRIWDPYFCDGAVVRNLASLGFPNVHNRNEDFYKTRIAPPSHHVLVTNPPYSENHIERCCRHCVTSQKPWCLLLPNFVHGKDWYKELVNTSPSLRESAPFYIGPVREAYHYWIPQGVPRPDHVGADGKTVPFQSCWYVHVPGRSNSVLRFLEKIEARQSEWVTAKTVRGLKWKAQKMASRWSAVPTLELSALQIQRSQQAASKQIRSTSQKTMQMRSRQVIAV